MEDKELQEMREQLAFLKEKLQEQEIVNEQMIKQSMKKCANELQWHEFKQVACAVLECILIPMFHFTFGFSWAFVVVTIILMLGSIYATRRINAPVKERKFYSQDVTTTLNTLLKVKQQYTNWLYYATPALCIPWIAWFCYELVTGLDIHGKYVWMVCSYIVVCGFFGFLLGLKWHKKTIAACQETIDMLRED